MGWSVTFYLCVLYKIGVAGKWLQIKHTHAHLTGHFRCMAFPNNLDGGGTPHSCALADALKEAFSLGALWNEWGMDVEITV